MHLSGGGAWQCAPCTGFGFLGHDFELAEEKWKKKPLHRIVLFLQEIIGMGPFTLNQKDLLPFLFFFVYDAHAHG